MPLFSIVLGPRSCPMHGFSFSHRICEKSPNIVLESSWKGFDMRNRPTPGVARTPPPKGQDFLSGALCREIWLFLANFCLMPKIAFGGAKIFDQDRTTVQDGGCPPPSRPEGRGAHFINGALRPTLLLHRPGSRTTSSAMTQPPHSSSALPLRHFCNEAWFWQEDNTIACFYFDSIL